SFVFSEKDTPLEPEDSQDKIDKARPLHEKAMELVKDRDFNQAIDKEKEAIEIAPNYWLPHAGLSYIFGLRHKTFDALREGTLATKTRHPAVADRNEARLLLSMHWFGPAQVEYKRALKLEPDSWQDRIGIADILFAQNKIDESSAKLDEICNSSKDFEGLMAVSERYLEIPNYAKAKTVLTKASEVAPDQASKQAATDSLFASAVINDDVPLISSLQGQVSADFKKEEPIVWFKAKTRLATSPAQCDDILKEAASVQTGKTDLMFYAIGESLLHKAQDSTTEKAQWLAKAQQALQNAAIRNTGEMRYELAVASAAEQQHDLSGISQALATLKESLPPETRPTAALDKVDPKEIPQTLANTQKLNLANAFTAPKPNAPADATFVST
ncbi:MAG: tetratricopeptide repeat protein, partial [Nitrososphaerales archaeon]